jgi:hypothetical protein
MCPLGGLALKRSGELKLGESVLRKIRKFVGVLAPMAFAVAGISAASASAATSPRAETMLDWQGAISHLRTPGPGCYHASFPALQWHQVKCVTAPERPLVPRASSTLRGGPEKVGDGHDYSAVVTGLISSATGTFADVSPKITEKGQIGGEGSKIANEFTLQLNTQFFSGSPACAKAKSPSKCQAWQQFVYETDVNQIFMQYWLIDYAATCPSGWFSYSDDCYTNSASATFGGGALTAKKLASVTLTASATSGGDDSISLSVGSGQATTVSAKDTKVDLASNWNTSEWGVFGDGGGSEAYFGKDSTLESVTTLTASSSGAPTCEDEGFTGETTNLTLTATPAIGSASSPTMASKQTNDHPSGASCAVAAG